ncbi:3-hydroxyisobutyrate dehydrogenase, mitochondrial-like [Liolophura sinensis]|uniref:3-hydroxyisobutyrate dehydrogenase, mitochondrial-like n=1 Tax=Liolophura sinensis TaxID=3198878 RepID=UPI003158C886
MAALKRTTALLLGSRCQKILSASRSFSSSPPSQSNQPPVGFIGLGNMGNHMARNLMKNGYPLVVFDVVDEVLNTLKSVGATVAGSPADVAAQATTIVTMLPSSPHVKEVYTGDSGILNSIQIGTLLLDSSTIDPQASKDVADLAKSKGAVYMDAPVSGGVNAARDAGLTFMVGGPQPSFDDAKKILSLLGKNIVYCGEVGTGQAAKICNNMLLAISMIGTAEAMNLGMRLGLDPKLLAGILNTSSGRCWSSEVYNPVPGVLPGVPSSNGYEGGFGTALMTKDLGLAQSAALNTQSLNPLGSMALQLYRLMCSSGYAEKDFSVAFQFLQQKNKS